MSRLFDDIPAEFFPSIVQNVAPPKPVFSTEELSHFGRWVKASGLKPEGAREFSLDRYPYQRELYDEYRAKPRQRVAIMKAAQTGLTVKLMNRGFFWTADALTQHNVGLYFPTSKGIEKLSAGRLRPMLRTSSRMQELMRDVDNVFLMRIGRSNLAMFGVMSGVDQDSTPIDVELVDEVRLMSTDKLERIMVRTTESTIRDPVTGTRGIIELNSTAGFPNKDIHAFFLESTQGWWTVPCPDPGCRRHQAGIILPREFAENHARVIGQEDSGWYYLKCPRCGARLPDAQQQHGWYGHENPGAQWLGYQFSQLGKGEGFLNSEIMPAWNRGLNVPEFYNSRLGLPYMDPDAVPAGKEVVDRNIDPTSGHHWHPEPIGPDTRWRALGIDQRAGEKHCVIKTLLPSGLHRLEHLAVIEASGPDAAREIIQLARAWGVKIVVMDGEPSYDLFITVARALPKGMVWQQDYVDGSAQVVRWEDKRRDKQIKKSSGELKYEYRCLIDRFKGLDWSLGLFRLQRNQLPIDLYELKVPRIIEGKRVGHSIGGEYVTHLGNLAKVKLQKTVPLPTGERVALVGEYTQVWRNLNLDPHFAHANLYADVGLARAHSLMPDSMPVHAPDPVPLDQNGIPPHLRPGHVEAQVKAAGARTCGGCKRFQAGYCRHPMNDGRNVRVREDERACEDFTARRD